MNKLIARTLLAVSLVTLNLPASAENAPAGADPKAMQEMMKKHAEFTTLGEPHKMLAGLAGKWSYTSKWWMTADAKPEESKGSATFKLILNQHYLQQEIKGLSMGKPWEGLGVTGYDNLKKRYVSTFMESMGTGIMTAEGTFDDSTKTLTDKGEYSCPTTGNTHEAYRAEWKMTDKNHMTYSMFTHGMDGKSPEFKSMEITYTRK